MTLAKPNWYVACSPRDPRKLIPELKLLLKYEGKTWDVSQQENFAEELKNLDSFEGEGYKKEIAFSTRDRVAKLKTYGFVYVKDGVLHITHAGKRICNTNIPEEVFMKQMLKWQFPSSQHRKNAYPYEKFLIRPFIFVSKLIKALGGISKTELAIFAFTTTNENDTKKVIKEIIKYRNVRKKIVGKVKKRKFDNSILYRRLKIAFKEFIEHDKMTIRESGEKKFSEIEFLATKIRSSYDMADAFIRHLRFTPLFTIQGSRVVVAESMLDVFEQIISEPITINQDYNDVESFYSYIGNPDIPSTIFDEKQNILAEIDKITKNIQSRYAEALRYDKNLKSPTIIDVSKAPIYKLKEYLFALLYEDTKYKKILLETQLRSKDSVKEIIETYQKIIDREVIEPATYFEWNTWRALLNIDDEEKIVPNFSIDKDLQPLSEAGGRKGDVEAYYPEICLLIEVTLSSGQRQANTEIEPVWRHVGRFQQQNKGKKTYGLFIAPKIERATYLDFFVRATNPLFEEEEGQNGEKVIIVPLSLEQFLDIFSFFSEIIGDKSLILYNLLKSFEEEADSGRHKHGGSWIRTFPELISKWKQTIKKS